VREGKCVRRKVLALRRELELDISSDNKKKELILDR
jgi:hypothetical protein